MLKKIYTELVLIRKELQAIKISLEPKEIIYQPKTKVVRVDGTTKRVPIDYSREASSSSTES